MGCDMEVHRIAPPWQSVGAVIRDAPVGAPRAPSHVRMLITVIWSNLFCRRLCSSERCAFALGFVLGVLLGSGSTSLFAFVVTIAAIGYTVHNFWLVLRVRSS